MEAADLFCDTDFIEKQLGFIQDQQNLFGWILRTG